MNKYFVATLTMCFVIEATDADAARDYADAVFSKYGLRLRTVRAATREDVELYGCGPINEQLLKRVMQAHA